MWTVLKSKVEAIAANDAHIGDEYDSNSNDHDSNTCREDDTVQENKTLRLELFAAYNRLQDTQDKLIKSEALMSLSDAEKNAKLYVAEEECAFQRALSSEHVKWAEELSQIVRNYERQNIKVNMELIERNAIKKELEQLRKANKEIRADNTAKSRAIHALQKEKREQAVILAELQKSATNSIHSYQSIATINEGLVKANIDLQEQVVAMKARAVLMQSDYSRALTKSQSLEVQMLSISAEVRHLEQKCLSLSREVLRLSNIEDVYKSSHDIIAFSSLDNNGETTKSRELNENSATPKTSANTTPATSEHGGGRSRHSGTSDTDQNEDTIEKRSNGEHEYDDWEHGSEPFMHGQQTEDCMCVGLGSIFFSGKKKLPPAASSSSSSASSTSLCTSSTIASSSSSSSSSIARTENDAKKRGRNASTS